MSEDFNNLFTTSVQTHSEANELLEKLITTARTEATYGQPVTQGEYTVITASELFVGMGVGYGYGGGGANPAAQGETNGEMGVGGGGGGGGYAAARPIAAIIIGPQGVRVDPIVDPTKMALAFFTTLGTMFMMLRSMKRGRK